MLHAIKRTAGTHAATLLVGCVALTALSLPSLGAAASVSSGHPLTLSKHKVKCKRRHHIQAHHKRCKRHKPPEVSRFGAQITSVATRLSALEGLGVERTRIGAHLDSIPSGPVSAAQAAGYQVLLAASNTQFPSSAPADLGVYQAQLGKALDVHHTPVVSIENEETADKFYSGTPSQYLAELRAAVPVAHARGIKISDGGLVSVGVKLATWYDLWNRGRFAEADSFATTSFASRNPKLLADLPSSSDPSKPILAGNPIARQTFDDTLTLIAAFRTLPIDYVNFHWYQGTPGTLKTSVDYLRRATGKNLISNEMGQYDQSPATVVALLSEAAALRIPWVNWFASDGSGGAIGLVNSDGSLRENGLAFRDFVQRCDGRINCGRRRPQPHYHQRGHHPRHHKDRHHHRG